LENTAVTSDATTSLGAGSEASFSDIEAITERQAKAKPEPAPKRPVKVEPKEPAENRESKERAPTPAKPAAKPAVKDGTKPDAPLSEVESSGEAKPAKRYKAKDGESVLELSGSATIPVIVDGKEIEIQLEDLRSNYSGKVVYDKKFAEVDRDRKAIEAQRTELNTLVSTLYDKVTKENDGEAAFDFLAELTGSDPVQLKIGMLKDQYKQLLPLFEMSEPEREDWFRQREIGFRERNVKTKEERFARSETETKQRAIVAKAQETFGIAPDRYSALEKHLQDYHAKSGRPGETVTPEQVAYADRADLTFKVINAVAPSLESSAHFDSIVTDIVTDLVKHPHLGEEHLIRVLKETFGEPAKQGDPGLRALGRKAQEAAAVGAREIPRRVESGSQKKPVLFFDDD
jgi:hypothetical protein